MAVRAKILCGQCGKEVRVGDASCRSCGTEIEWPVGIRRATSERGKKDDRTPVQPKPRKTFPAYAFLAVAAVAIFVIVIMTEKSPAPSPVPQPTEPAAQASSGPDMAALPQIESLQAEADAKPRDAGKALSLANALHDARFYDRAIRTYRQVLEITPKNADARVDLGICLHETGKDEEAVKEMKRALADSPNHLNAMFNLGIVNLSLGNLAESNDWFRKTAALAPSSEIGQRAQELLTQHNQPRLQQPH